MAAPSLARRGRSDERGAVMVESLVAIPTLLAFFAMILQLSYMSIASLVVQHAAHNSATAVRRMCPAIMLARSRTLRENGRTKNFEMNSIGTTSTSIAFGTPGGTIEPLRYFHGPCTAIPTTIMMM